MFPARIAVRVQLQNRGALCLAQHMVLAPEEVFRRCAGAVFQPVVPRRGTLLLIQLHCLRTG
jgi:hypothetical protein